MAAESRRPTGGMVKVRCPNAECRKVLAVKAELGGKKGRCPICGQAMTIPKLPESVVAGKAGVPVPIEGGAPPPGEPTGRTAVLHRAAPSQREGGKAPAEEAEEKPEKRPREPHGVGAPEAGPHPTPRTLKRIAMEATEAAYVIEGNTLKVTGAIGYDLNPVFRAKCEEILRMPHEEIVIDLVPVMYLSSSHLGVLAELMGGAELAGKKVIVLASLKAARVIRLAGLDRMCELEEM